MVQRGRLPVFRLIQRETYGTNATTDATLLLTTLETAMRNRSGNIEGPLIIDLAAAAEKPSADAFAEWASDKKVFVSSVMSELPGERQAAATAIRAVGARPVLFEDFGGRDDDPEQAYLSEVESSDIYLGILGNRYGKPLPSRFSATHAEYLHAEKHDLRIAVWACRTNNREGHEQSFLEEVRTFHVAPEFSSPADLQRQVEERLRTVAAEDLSPWCKLHNFVFRAAEITDAGDEIEVRARVRNDEVAHGLEQLRPGEWGQGQHGQLTWQGRSKFVGVRTLETKITIARSRVIRMGLQVSKAPQDPMLEVSVSGRSPADLTESALRTALFGGANPFMQDYMGFMAEIPDPWGPIRDRKLSEEILRPIAELLLAEILVGSGRATRITSFKLGVRVQGRRKCQLAWQPPRRYSNEREVTRTIQGWATL
jgi:hypothetical protein